jgi:predicted amidohydrolase
LKIGYIQFGPRLGDLDANLEILGNLLLEASDADLIVLPELCNSGYNFASEEQARTLSEEIGAGRFSRFLEEQCRTHGMHIVSGINERAGDRLYNSSILVGPRGIEGTYRKLHLFKNEKDFFTPGDRGLPIFEVGSRRIGMLICFDWIFPEAWRVLALKGAEVICHPSNLVLPGFAQRAIPVHAMINRIYIVTANRTGTENEITFTGGSLVADPKGDVLVEGPREGRHVGIAAIEADLARNKKVTDRNDVFEDRRPEEYDLLGRPLITKG